jgi:hypothetical protein
MGMGAGNKKAGQDVETRHSKGACGRPPVCHGDTISRIWMLPTDEAISSSLLNSRCQITRIYWTSLLRDMAETLFTLGEEPRVTLGVVRLAARCRRNSLIGGNYPAELS